VTWVPGRRGGDDAGAGDGGELGDGVAARVEEANDLRGPVVEDEQAVRGAQVAVGKLTINLKYPCPSSLLSFWQLPPPGLRLHRRFLGQLTSWPAPRAARGSFAQERSNSASSRGTERARPVAGGRRRGPSLPAVERHVDPDRFHLPSTLDGKRNTARLLCTPAGAIAGSHAVLTSTASSPGPKTVRGVFQTAREKAAPSMCLRMRGGRRNRRGAAVRRARPGAASVGTVVRELLRMLVELLAQMDQRRVQWLRRLVLHRRDGFSGGLPRSDGWTGGVLAAGQAAEAGRS
jgi:hypothetical protein